MEFNIKLSNGQLLRGLIRSPGENIRAVIILIHGLGEHIHRYNPWADLFIQNGIGLTGIDLPGHGRSEGRRGNIRNYKLLSEVIDIMVQSCNRTFPSVPVFIYGHSLGGGIVINYLLHNNPRIKGAIVTSPWLCLSFEPNKLKLFIASLLSYLLPGLTQSSGLIVEHLSRDRTEIEKYKNDPLVHDKISLSLFCGTVEASKYSLKNASDLRIPMLIIHGSEDRICSPEGSREFADKAEMAELKIWDGGYHELHNEPFKDELFDFILAWIDKRLS